MTPPASGSGKTGEDPNGGNPDPVAVARQACGMRDVDPADARLLRHYSNAVVVLPRAGAVARIATGRHDVAQISRSQQLASWLTERHAFPATAPLPGAEFVELNSATTVSFWVYYPQPDPPRQLTSAHMGQLLADLHHLDQPPIELPPWVPLGSLEQTLLGETVASAIDDSDRDWLWHRIQEVRDEIAALDWPLGHGLIHGDAWAGNLLWAGEEEDRVLLGDWDRVAHGPREVDLVPTWHAARRYGKSPGWIKDFIERYGYDLAQWSGFRALLAMRDLVQISGPLRRAPDSAPHADALRQRLDSLRAGDTATSWAAF